MKLTFGTGARPSVMAALGMMSVVVGGILGYGCNSQKSEAPKKAETQSASGLNENRRNELNHSNNSDRGDKDDQDDDKGDKSSSKNSSRRSQGSDSSKSSASRTSSSNDDFDAIISRLGLTRGEAQTLQRFACSMTPEELSRLASRFGFGGGGSSGRNGFNLGSLGPNGFSRSDLDALRALGSSGRNVSPETIKRAQDALCSNSGGSGGSSSSRNSNSRASRDDDDDDDN